MNNLEVKKIMQFTIALRNKLLRNKGNKRCVTPKNYKTLLTEILKDLNKGGGIPCS